MQTTCDRCNEVCALCEVVLVEKIYGVGEVVCKPCLQNEYETQMEIVLFGSLDE